MKFDIFNMEWKVAEPGASLKVCAIYLIQLMDPFKSTECFWIKRWTGIDKMGILEIGQTTFLGHRRGQFRGAVTGIGRGTEGLTARFIFDKNPWLREIFGTREMFLKCIRFVYVEVSPEELKALEAEALKQYCGRFGEPPPLNSQIPGEERKRDCLARKVAPMSVPRKVLAAGPLPENLQWLTAPPRNPLTGVSAVYIVWIGRPKDPARPNPIERFGGTDLKGILHIGETADLGCRQRMFLSAATGRKKTGEGGCLHYLFDIDERLEKTFGPREDLRRLLHFSYIETKRSLLAIREFQLQNHYISLYAEMPPLDNQIPGKWRYYDG